jgi:hypothetical protein
MVGLAVQLSVAVALPVCAGRLEVSQLIVVSWAQAITGFVVSCTVMVWLQLLALLQASVAVHVLVIVFVLPQ